MINKYSFKKGLSMILSLMVALSISGVALAKPSSIPTKVKPPITRQSLVTLGDSITFGYGLEKDRKLLSKKAYPQLLADELRYEVHNLSVTGITSSELLDRLKNNDYYRTAVKNAGLLTLNIGGNDMLRYLMKLNFSNLDMNTVLDDIRRIAKDYNIKLGLILNEVRLLNPDAPILQYGFYNPLHDNHPVSETVRKSLPKFGYYAFYKQLNFLIKSINKINYRNYANKVNNLYYVDIHDEFEKYGRNYSKSDLFCDKVHPSETGQKLLKEAGYKVLSKNIVF